MKKGEIILIPTLLGDTDPKEVLPALVWDYGRTIKHFVVEDVKTSRRFLKKLDKSIDINELTFYLLNEHTQDSELAEMLITLKAGKTLGLMSDAGLPGVADPGAKLVEMAHNNGFKVKPLSGPSSIFMALMASGLNGQSFAFTGYLPREDKNCKRALLGLEMRARKENQSQIFMETPYRNNKLLDIILSTLYPSTKLCIATDISTPNEAICTRTIKAWQSKKFDLHKRPTIFIIK